MSKTKMDSPCLVRLSSIVVSSVLGLTLISGCSSPSDAGDLDTTSSTEVVANSDEDGATDSSSGDAEEAVAEEPATETSAAPPNILSFSGSKEVETNDGYTFKFGWDWNLVDATSDVRDSIPGETAVNVTSAGSATLENTTPGRVMDFSRSQMAIYGYYGASSEICENLAPDAEAAGCWIELGRTFYLDPEDSQGRFSLEDGAVQSVDFSEEYMINQGPEQTFGQIKEDSAEDFIADLQEPEYTAVLTDEGWTGQIDTDPAEASGICMTMLGQRGDEFRMIATSPKLSCDELSDIDDSQVG